MPNACLFENKPNRLSLNIKKYNPESVKEGQISMTIADTEFFSPIEITEKLKDLASRGHFGYLYNDGRFESSVCKWIKKRYAFDIKSSWVGYSTGVINGMSIAVRSFTKENDKILIQTPVYQNFKKHIELNNRIAVNNPLKLIDGRYEIDFENLEQGLSDEKVKMMFVCNPHNPTCRCYTKKELEKIGNLCIKYDVIVISDEIHLDLVLKDAKHVPMASISRNISNRCITFINPSKTFNIAGLFTAAWFTQNKSLWNKLNDTQSALKAICRNTFGEQALITAYDDCGYYADELVDYISLTRDKVNNYINENIDGIKLIYPEATYLFWLDCRGLGFRSQHELNDFFENEAKLKLNSGTTYGDEGEMFMRMNVGVQYEVVQEALERLAVAVKNRKQEGR